MLAMACTLSGTPPRENALATDSSIAMLVSCIRSMTFEKRHAHGTTAANHAKADLRLVATGRQRPAPAREDQHFALGEHTEVATIVTITASLSSEQQSEDDTDGSEGCAAASIRAGRAFGARRRR